MDITMCAKDWLADHDNGDGFLACLEVNASHKADCYTDTSYWTAGEDYDASQLEAEIERILKG